MSSIGGISSTTTVPAKKEETRKGSLGAASSSSSTKTRVVWGYLARDIQYRMHQFLSLKDLCVVEGVSREWELGVRFTYGLQNVGDQRFCQWREARVKRNPFKWNRLLTSALIDIVNQMQVLPRKNYIVITARLRAKYAHLIHLFPSFRCYAEMRFSPYPSTSSTSRSSSVTVRPSGSSSLFACLFSMCTSTPPSPFLTVQKEIERASADEHATSDAILHVLIEIEKRRGSNSPLPIHLLKLIEKAIRNGATCASLLLIETIRRSGVIVPIELQEQMAIASAHAKDYRALNTLLKNYSQERLQDLHKKHPTLASVFYHLAIFEKDLDKMEALLTKALEGYGEEDVPVEVLAEAGYLKSVLRQFEAADKLFQLFFKKFADQLSAEEWYWKGMSQFQLYQVKELDMLFIRALRRCALRNMPLQLQNGDRRRTSFKPYLQADELYTRALPLLGDAVPKDLLFSAAIIKYHTDNFSGADRLFTKVLAQYTEEEYSRIPYFQLAMIASAKQYLGQYEEADELFTEALEKGEDAQSDALLLYHAAKTKFALGKYIEADKLYTVVRTSWGEKFPALALLSIAKTKYFLGDYVEAEKLCTEVLRKLGKEEALLTSDELDLIASTKFALGHYEQADEWFTKALNKCKGNKEKIPADLLVRVVKNKIELGQYQKALAFIEQILAYPSLTSSVAEYAQATAEKLKSHISGEQTLTIKERKVIKV